MVSHNPNLDQSQVSHNPNLEQVVSHNPNLDQSQEQFITQTCMFFSQRRIHDFFSAGVDSFFRDLGLFCPPNYAPYYAPYEPQVGQ